MSHISHHYTHTHTDDMFAKSHSQDMHLREEAPKTCHATSHRIVRRRRALIHTRSRATHQATPLELCVRVCRWEWYAACIRRLLSGEYTGVYRTRYLLSTYHSQFSFAYVCIQSLQVMRSCTRALATVVCQFPCSQFPCMHVCTDAWLSSSLQACTGPGTPSTQIIASSALCLRHLQLLCVCVFVFMCVCVFAAGRHSEAVALYKTQALPNLFDNPYVSTRGTNTQVRACGTSPACQPTPILTDKCIGILPRYPCRSKGALAQLQYAGSNTGEDLR